MSRLKVDRLADFLANSLGPAIDECACRELARMGNGRLVIDARSGACTHSGELVPLSAGVEVWRRFDDELDRQVAQPTELSTAELQLQLRIRHTSHGRERTCSIELTGTAGIAMATGEIARVGSCARQAYALPPVPTALQQLHAQLMCL